MHTKIRRVIFNVQLKKILDPRAGKCKFYAAHPDHVISVELELKMGLLWIKRALAELHAKDLGDPTRFIVNLGGHFLGDSTLGETFNINNIDLVYDFKIDLVYDFYLSNHRFLLCLSNLECL